VTGVNATDSFPAYPEFARQVQATGILSDAWIDGVPRFRLQGVVLQPSLARALRLAVERIGAVYQELIDLIWDHPDWLDTYFHLTPYQKLMWFSAQGRWHGISRADLFRCTDGRMQCCEVNSDTPSGEAEAVLLNRLLGPYHEAVQDPNRGLPGRFWRMLVASHGGCPPRMVGIVYPTELSEDLSMIAIYQQWLEARGCRVILGSPYNLHACSDGSLVSASISSFGTTKPIGGASAKSPGGMPRRIRIPIHSMGRCACCWKRNTRDGSPSSIPLGRC
jgi:hypothetical protein